MGESASVGPERNSNHRPSNEHISLIMTNQEPFLSVSGIDASYDNQSLTVKGVSFDLAEGELGCLLGPSGCGKTTILRAISGFQPIRSGSISLGGTTLSSKHGDVVPEKRGVGMVFQDHALFPHLDISANIAFGLGSLSKHEQKKRISDLLELVGMQDHAHKYPHELSGGQSQRIALARAIAPRPKLLLMDEPFSNLDTELRESLGYEVRELLKKLNMTAIMVTHDQHDAFALGDHVGVMNAGELMQWDSSFNLYHAPSNRFVANFIGDGVFIEGKMLEHNLAITPLGEIRGQSINNCLTGRDIDLLIRPDDVVFDNTSNIRGEITRKAFKGAQTLYTLSTQSGHQLMSLLPSHDDYEIGDSIGVSINADHIVCFAKSV